MNRLKDLREDRDWTQADVAKMIGVHFTTISKWELGTNALTDENINRFCELFDVTADYLLGRSSSPRPSVTNADAALLRAYHDAPESIRAIIDTALEPYIPQRNSSESVSA